MSTIAANIRDILNNLSPNLVANNFYLGEQLESIFTALTSGNLAIQATAADVDSIAKAGGHFSVDWDTTDFNRLTSVGSGLTFGWTASQIHNGLASVTVAAGTLEMTPSQTNYVEVDRAGTVSANTSAFTSGRMPLFQVVAGASVITSITQKKTLLTLIGTAGVVGSMLSAAGALKEIPVHVGTLSATGTAQIPLPNLAGTISRISLMVETTVATDDTNYWTFGVVNKGAAGSGTTAVVDGTAAANSTKTTGGSALTNYVQRDLTLSSTPADLAVTAKNVLLLTCTKASSGANLVGLAVLVEMSFTA